MKDCATGCAQCTSLEKCFACKEGWFLYNNVCLSTCPLGTFKSIFTRMCEGKINFYLRMADFFSLSNWLYSM